MTKHLLLTLAYLTGFASHAQIKATIIDSLTKEEVPYVNIWVENKDIGTTSDLEGRFVLNGGDSTYNVVFSAIGYSTKVICSDSINNVLELTPHLTELEEVMVRPVLNEKKLVLGTFKKSEVTAYYACTKPWLVARYFEYKEGYSETEYLSKIKVLTNSYVKNARFNVRLYSVNKEGGPGAYLYDKNIIATARKRKKFTEVDLLDLQIRFPKEGFFIAIEWFIVDANEYEYTYTEDGSRKKYKKISYEPSIAALSSDTDEESWIFREGKWHQQAALDPWKPNKYSLLAIELTLTN